MVQENKKKIENESHEFPKERYNILNGSIPLTEEEKQLLDENSKRISEWAKKMYNLKD